MARQKKLLAVLHKWADSDVTVPFTTCFVALSAQPSFTFSFSSFSSSSWPCSSCCRYCFSFSFSPHSFSILAECVRMWLCVCGCVRERARAGAHLGRSLALSRRSSPTYCCLAPSLVHHACTCSTHLRCLRVLPTKHGEKETRQRQLWASRRSTFRNRRLTALAQVDAVTPTPLPVYANTNTPSPHPLLLAAHASRFSLLSRLFTADSNKGFRKIKSELFYSIRYEVIYVFCTVCLDMSIIDFKIRMESVSNSKKAVKVGGRSDHAHRSPTCRGLITRPFCSARIIVTPRNKR